MAPPDDHFGLPSVAPENVTPGQLLLILQSMHGQIVELRRQRDADQQKLADLVDAWSSAKGVLNVLKFFAFFGAAVATVYGLWNGFLNHLRGG